MMEREFSHILSQYGQDVTVYRKTPAEELHLRAFVQPMSDRGTEQSAPSPMGQVMQDRFLYLGPSECALDNTCKIEFLGEIYRVQSAHPVRVGQTVSHWWAVLTHRSEEVRQ